MQRPFTAYDGDEPYVFVCYSHEDGVLVYPEIVRLHESGFNIWYDEGIAPASEWSETLARQIKGCATFLYFVTPHSVTSEHCRREVNFALGRSRRMVIVHLEPTTLPDGLSLSLSNLQAIQRYEHPRPSYESNLDRTLREPSEGQTSAVRPTLTLGEWTLDMGTERLLRDSDECQLDPKELSVLLHLIDRAPEVVTSEGLLSRTWPDVVVTDNVLRQVITRLRRALGDDAKHPRYIETLPKRGYRLCAEIGHSDSRPPDVPAPVPRPLLYRRRAFLASLAVLLALAAAYWLGTAQPTNEDLQRTRLAVQPFTYPAGDEQLEGYATLLRNEVAHHLGRIAQSRMDLTQNVDDADFVTMGSMSKVGDELRLSIQVVQQDSGIVMWSKGLDLPKKPTDDLVVTRPEHLASIVYKVVSSTLQASKPTRPNEAVRELVAGLIETNEMWQGLGGGDWDAAHAHFKRASDLDPQFAWPLVELANLYLNLHSRTLRYEDAAGPMHEYMRLALEIDPHLWTGVLGWINTHDLDYAAAAANYSHALENGWPAQSLEFQLGFLSYVQGELEVAIRRFNTAIEMGAMENKAMAHVAIAGAHLAGGRYDAAVNAAEKAVLESDGTGDYAHVVALTVEAFAHCYNGDFASARETVDYARATYGEAHEPGFAGPLAMLGETEAAREILMLGEVRWAAGEADFWGQYFWGYFHLGDLERAFVWLNRAIEDREVGLLPPLRRAPILDPIRDDPRFVAAMAHLAEIEATGSPITSVAYP